MKKKKIFQLTFSILFSTLLVVSLVYASWTAPGQNPPDGNVEAPINVGPSNQWKKGKLGIGDASQGFYWFSRLGESLVLENKNNEAKVIVGQDGSIGIGTTNPSGTLHLVSQPAAKLIIGPQNNGVGGASLYLISTPTWFETLGSGAGLKYDHDNKKFRIYAVDNDSWANGERVIIDAQSGETEIKGILNMSNHKITNLSEPENPSDAATKNYVDSRLGGGGGSCTWRYAVDDEYTLTCLSGEFVAGIHYEGAEWHNTVDWHSYPEIDAIYCCQF